MSVTVVSAVTGEGEIELSGQLDGTPDEVWDLLTDSACLPLWLGAPIIWDLVVGGGIEVEVDSGHRFSGTFVAIEPPHRLVFTWGWRSGPIPIEPGSTTVEMTTAANEGGTRFSIVHTDLGRWAETNIGGWTRKIARLQAAATS